jgi:hypothetical protein
MRVALRSGLAIRAQSREHFGFAAWPLSDTGCCTAFCRRPRNGVGNHGVLFALRVGVVVVSLSARGQSI